MVIRRSRTQADRPLLAATSAGYTLVAAVVLATVLSILVAAALPSWSQALQRDKEEELIFRGMQYAEAIRIFQLRFGRLPVRLEELFTVNPRCIRQLWKDPMTKSGDWGLIYAQGGGRRPGQGGRQPGVAPNQRQGRPVAAGGGPSQQGQQESGFGRRSGRAVAPILGVHSMSGDKAIKQFLGGQSHSDWLFTADIVPVAQIVPGSLNAVRANATWVGRPFPAGLSPQPGGAPSNLQQGTAPGQKNGNRQRNRRSNRSGN